MWQFALLAVIWECLILVNSLHSMYAFSNVANAHSLNMWTPGSDPALEIAQASMVSMSVFWWAQSSGETGYTANPMSCLPVGSKMPEGSQMSPAYLWSLWSTWSLCFRTRTPLIKTYQAGRWQVLPPSIPCKSLLVAGLDVLI